MELITTAATPGHRLSGGFGARADQQLGKSGVEYVRRQVRWAVIAQPLMLATDVPNATFRARSFAPLERSP
ncbi:hypothetical protein GCM10012275_11290 [Longimycelium tulufanense]|uniref:Uncharacterized protein n=1 Tax=Longimycelium tulufanense TaxID=907463 RepID=A0A8J3C6R5_9PSEU|nr:hypothetical protein [Longimycelium tulufanense]GGM42067.1 hypothetical protein GCM10012275_11290 [Longimycelium tulufanense]